MVNYICIIILRYHSSIIDAHLLNPGDDFADLPETFVIFITEKDVIGKGKQIYRIERKIEETGESFDDGEHIIYVNGADEDFCRDKLDIYWTAYV